MGLLARAYRDDLAQTGFDTTPNRQGSAVERQRDKHALRGYPDQRDPRQSLVRPDQTKAVKRELRQLRTKTAASGDEQADRAYRIDGSLEILQFAKCGD